MIPVRLTLDPAFRVGPVRRRTFGSFVEHLGRCVYTGIHDPAHPTADADGFRKDVLELTRELGVSTVRYPGGNFVSGYRWEDGVGPRDQRPARLDLAWHSTDPNTVGVDEFMRWARLAEVEPMMAVNLGTRGVQEAVDLLEYCNVRGGTRLSDQRRANGARGPVRRAHVVPGQRDGRPVADRPQDRLRVRPARRRDRPRDAHGRPGPRARRLRLVRRRHPDVRRVGARSCSPRPTSRSTSSPPTPTTGRRTATSARSSPRAVDMDHFVESVSATADAVRAHKKLDKRIHISFDEWNVWYQHRAESKPPTGHDWPVAPVLLEDRYNVADAVVVGNLLISLLRHTDRVHSASLAQLVNVIAPIMTEPGGRSWKQTIFHPFAQASRYARGRRAPGRRRGADLRDGEVRRRRRWSTPWPPATPRRATSRCSRSTAR